MSKNDASRITIDNSRVTLQIVASLTDNSRGIIYDGDMFIVQATWSIVECSTTVLQTLANVENFISYNLQV